MTTFKNVAPLAALLLLGACSKIPESATAAPPAAAAAAPVSGVSYELVQVERQDPPGQDLAMNRDLGYALCKIGAEAANKPVKPFPVPPPGYGEIRITTITNGTSIVTKTETTGGGDTGMTVENGCEFKIGMQKSVAVKIFHANKMTFIGNDDNGGPLKLAEENDMGEIPDLGQSAKDTSHYTDARTVNGVALRCVPKDYWLKDTNKHLDMREMCVYATDGVVVNESREPMIVLSHVRVDLLNPKYAYTAITEPVSMRKLTAGAPDPYQAASWTK